MWILQIKKIQFIYCSFLNFKALFKIKSTQPHFFYILLLQKKRAKFQLNSIFLDILVKPNARVTYFSAILTGKESKINGVGP